MKNLLHSVNTDQVHFIRNATMILNYAGHRILVDPMFSLKAAFGSISGKEKSPLVDLPIPISEIMKDVDLVLVTHTHPDHFDEEAIKILDREIDLINQPADQDTMQKLGFKNAKTIQDQLSWKDIKIIRTIAEHGTGSVLNMMGEVSGFILQAAHHPGIYIIGDAVWTNDIYQNIKKYQPDYIIANTGGARMPGYEATPILMDEAQAMSLIQESGDAKVIAVHMDAIDHCRTTRDILKKEAEKYKFKEDKLLIPLDGQTLPLR